MKHLFFSIIEIFNSLLVEGAKLKAGYSLTRNTFLVNLFPSLHLNDLHLAIKYSKRFPCQILN